MNITLTAPKKNMKIVGNQVQVSVSENMIKKAFRDAEKQAWEEKILKRKVDPKDLDKLTSWEDLAKEMGV